jgi:uncharacterized repeat protein (TIGR01451 family)
VIGLNARTALLALGTAAAAAGIAVAVGALEVGLTQPVLIVVGLLALAAGLRPLFGRTDTGDRLQTPDPEQRVTVPVPGESLADALDDFRSRRTGHTVSGSVAGLRSAAVAALTRFEGDTDERANERIEDGSWTSDRVAAAFLSESVEAPSRSVRERVGALVGRDPQFRSGISHAVAAIAAIGDDTTPDARPLPRADLTTGRSNERWIRTATDPVDGTVVVRERATDYWYGIGAVALLAVGVGVVSESSAVVLSGVVGIGYAGFARALSPPDVDLSVTREPSDSEPAPGDEIDLVVTITNERDAFVPDLRFVDGVPSGMAVVDGSSRLGTALRPGESVTLEYTVVVERGNHEFDPALAIVRDLSRSTERECLVGSETTIVCEPSLRPIAAPVPLRAAAATFSGRLQTADGGTGTTFHSVRAYRRGDPLSRVDWNRHAKTGDLATLEFHEERAARVVVVVDARTAAYLAPNPEAPHAVDRSVAAAGRIAATLLADGDTVGLAGIGPIDGTGATDATDACWLAPGSGRHHEVRFASLLATHPQFAPAPSDAEGRWHWQLRSIRRRLSAETQIVFLTPLCDYGSAEIARRLDARGHPVTVVSPDPTGESTAGECLARVARRIRRFDLQRAGIPVVDWPADESIDAVFARRSAGGRR